MMDFAHQTQAELLSRLEAGIADVDAQIAALRDAQEVAAADEPSAQAAMLRTLDDERLAGCALALASMVRVGDALLDQLFELLDDVAFRRTLDEVMSDDRLADADLAETVQWARVRHTAGQSHFEHLMRLRGGASK